MKIVVKAKPNSKEEKVIRSQPDMFAKPLDDYYTVSVKEPPVQGKANEAIIRVLAEHFGVSRSKVRISSGLTSKQKIVEINI